MEERNQIYWNIWLFGHKFINTSSIESSNKKNTRAKDDTHKKWTIPYNKKNILLDIFLMLMYQTPSEMVT